MTLYIANGGLLSLKSFISTDLLRVLVLEIDVDGVDSLTELILEAYLNALVENDTSHKLDIHNWQSILDDNVKIDPTLIGGKIMHFVVVSL